ncbi:TetR family transcriptional regulator [Nocardia gipuzkoensis]|jgi:AcrR family transcriptional regulator|uniref:TetR/AcrR family transcriptional regulator n=1 Tax=Nocardia abscessus TaxID=120957 RepID=UPI000A04A1DC|nr:TetR/AcrR family transcriptional regulator [Nocardia abscessus]
MPRLTRAESMQRTRNMLLTAAEEVFAEKGFAQASLEDIADRAGYSRGAVYANFTNKEDLFLSLLGDWLDRDIEESEEILAAGGDAMQTVDTLRGRGGNRFADRKRFVLMLEFRLYAMRNPPAAQALRDYDRVSRDWYARSTRRVIEGMGLSLPAPAEQMALVALALEHGIALLAHTDPEAISQDSFLDAVTLLGTALIGAAERERSAQ